MLTADSDSSPGSVAREPSAAAASAWAVGRSQPLAAARFDRDQQQPAGSLGSSSPHMGSTEIRQAGPEKRVPTWINSSAHTRIPSLTLAVPPGGLSRAKTLQPLYPTGKPSIWDSSAAWLVSYFLANLSLTLYNKLVMNSFPFPWALTGVHALCGTVGAQLALRGGFFVPQRSLETKENLVLLAFSALYTVNIAVSNVSLNLVTVPFHQVVRATTPIFAIALGALMLGKRTPRKTVLALIPVVAGVGFATYGDYYFTRWGFALTLFGTVLAALKTIVTNMILVGRLKLHPLDLLVRMSPLALVQCLLASWWTGELARVHEAQLDLPKLAGLAVNGGLAFFLNVVSFTANKKTSALSMTVAANVKQVLTVVLAVLIFDLRITPMNMGGITLTLAGGAAYAKVEYDAKKEKEQAVTTGHGATLGAVSEKGQLTHTATGG